MTGLFALCFAPIASAQDELERSRAAASFNVPQSWLTLSTVVNRVELAYGALGDRVASAWLVTKAGRPRYIVRTVSNSGFREIDVDAQTGEYSVFRGEIGAPLGVPGDDDAELAQFRAMAATISGFEVNDALNAVRLFAQGAAPFAVYFNLQAGKLVISVEVLRGTVVERLDVNALTGGVTLAGAVASEPAR
jgi:hypothetical protein